MKTKVLSTNSGAAAREIAVKKAARLRKLRTVLKKGMGMSPKELKDSLWPGYAERYRADSRITVNEPKSSYGKRGARFMAGFASRYFSALDMGGFLLLIFAELMNRNGTKLLSSLNGLSAIVVVSVSAKGTPRGF